MMKRHATTVLSVMLLPTVCLLTWMAAVGSSSSSSGSSSPFSQRYGLGLPRKQQHQKSRQSFLPHATVPWTQQQQDEEEERVVVMSTKDMLLLPSATLAASLQTKSLLQSLFELRGGEEEEESDDEEEEEDDVETTTGVDYAAMLEQVVDVTKTKVVPVVVAVSKRTYKVVKKASLATYHALQRAVKAAMEVDAMDENDEEEEEEDEFEITMADQALKLATKLVRTVQRMVVAALDFSSEVEGVDEDDDDEGGEVDILVVETKKKVAKTVVVEEAIEKDVEEATESIEESTTVPTKLDDTRPETGAVANDFGWTLSEMYEVADGRTAKATVKVMGGSFKDALAKAKEEARILLVFIPSERPNGGRRFLFGGKAKEEEGPSNDKLAIESLLSTQTAKAANKKARKKKSDTGSFAIWSAKAGSSEAKNAIKQLEVQTSNKGDPVPILAAVYPAYASGRNNVKLSTIVPKLLSQHHGNPPPDAEGMASWMNTVRKRNAQYYIALQKDAKEISIQKERVEGLSESIKSDTEKREEEAKLKAEQKAKEEAEAKRQKEIKERRKELKNALPDDFKSSTDARKVSLRFSDGRSGQRGFSPDQPLSDLFNWVDAMFEMERETVVLTTMNGKLTFSWDEDTLNATTLEDAGLGKMTAFRVTVKKEEDEENEAVAA